MDSTSGELLPSQQENISVVLRVRPLNDMELKRGDKKVLSCVDKRTVRFNGGSMDDFGRPPTNTQKAFTFNAIADEDTTQEAFYDASGVQQLVLKALDGYSATVFAYGQTGSGKTYSVSGAEHVIVDEGYHGGDTREGLVPRAARQICEAMAQRNDVQGHNAYALKAACFEIYNEQVIDLVNPEAGPLQIRESRSQGFFIENLLVVDCAEVAELMEVFKEGTRNRKVGAHALNRDSSRSHSALVLYVDRTTLDPETGDEVKQYGKITFVDLAGSERLKFSGSSGEMLKETGNINRSLFTLGKVIATLDKGDAFVPYRDSKLTKLLMDSLGGSSSCIMVACCSPSARYSEETLSTLQYAARAGNICNKPVVQLEPQQRLIMQLRAEVAQLRAENAQLRLGQGLPPAEPRRPSSAALRLAPQGSGRQVAGGHAGAAGGATAGLAGGAEMLTVLPQPPRAASSPSTRCCLRVPAPPLSPARAPVTPGGAGRVAQVGTPPRQAAGSAGTYAGSEEAGMRRTGARAELYEKAVGYAEGYAAGIDQARDVLSNGTLALELSSSLAGYDLSQIHGGGALCAPAAPAAHAAQRAGGGGRLPPLGGWGEGGSEGLRAHAEELQEANSRLTGDAEELRLECRRLRHELDAARAGARAAPGREGARGGPGGEAPQPQPHQQDAGRPPPYRARALDWGLGRDAGASQDSPRVRAGRVDARGTKQAAAPPAAGGWGGARAYSLAPAVGGEGADAREATGGARPIVFHETEAAMWGDFATPPRQREGVYSRDTGRGNSREGGGDVLHHSRSADALLQECTALGSIKTEQ